MLPIHVRHRSVSPRRKRQIQLGDRLGQSVQSDASAAPRSASVLRQRPASTGPPQPDCAQIREADRASILLGGLFDHIDKQLLGSVLVSTIRGMLGRGFVPEGLAERQMIRRDEWVAAVIRRTRGMREEIFQKEWIAPMKQAIAVAMRPERYYQCRRTGQRVCYHVAPGGVPMSLQGPTAPECILGTELVQGDGATVFVRCKSGLGWLPLTDPKGSECWFDHIGTVDEVREKYGTVRTLNSPTRRLREGSSTDTMQGIRQELVRMGAILKAQGSSRLSHNQYQV